jgi:Uma2 family endonuclease
MTGENGRDDGGDGRMSAANQLPDQMTVIEFLAWNSQDSDRWELIDGTLRAMAPAAPRHGAIQGEVARLIGNRLAALRPECRVIIEPGIQPKVQANLNVRVPDLAVTCAPLDPDDRLLREPLLVVEILSPSNKTETWANIWSYVTIPSVWEILVLHTAEIRADLLRREEDGTWPDDPLTLTLGDTVSLESINFTAPITAFYRTA